MITLNQSEDLSIREARIINYIKRTAYNSSINYYIKQSKTRRDEFLSIHNTIECLDKEKLGFSLRGEPFEIKIGNSRITFQNIALFTEFQNLKKSDQFILFNNYILGYSDHEISEQLSLTVQCITKRRQRALKKLKTRLI